MISPAPLQGPSLDLFPSVLDLLRTPKVDIGWRQIVQRLMVPGIVVILHEFSDGGFQFGWGVVILQYGEFRETEAQFQGGLHAIGIYFTNSKARNLFGETSIVLIFENEMYVDARVPVPLTDSYRSLCNK